MPIHSRAPYQKKDWRRRSSMASLSPLTILVCVLVVLFQSPAIRSKTVGQCDVAQAMLSLGQTKAKAAAWVCLAKFASGFYTQAVKGPYHDGSYDFGIFQINDKYCKLGTKTSCGVKCTDLVSDNIIPSAKCALKIFEKEGFEHWKEWSDTCQKMDRTRFLLKCILK